MHFPWQAGDPDGAMQQTPALEAHLRDVLVMGVLDGKAREDRIPMVPVTVGDIAAVGGGRPNRPASHKE